MDRSSQQAVGDEEPPHQAQHQHAGHLQQRYSLDPTGMFRNRGRRVVAGSRSSPVRSSPSPVNGQNIDSSGQQHTREQRVSYRRRYDNAVQPRNSGEIQPQGDSNNQMEPNEVDGNTTHTHITKKEEGRPSDPDSGETLPHYEYASGKIVHDPQRKETEGGNVHSDENDSHNEAAIPLDCPNIAANKSEDSNDSGRALSNVGSTVSVMGSITGEDSSAIDEDRLLAVRRRMMNDVAEVLEEEGDDESDSGSKSCASHESNEEGGDTRTEQASDALNITLASNADNNDTLNISLECNADTDTSLLEDHPLDDINPPQDETIENDEDDRFDAIHAESNGKDTIPEAEHESPFRAAFRRSAKGMSNHLPPLSSQMLAATPSEYIDKAATTASRLPQLARQCFSFEDTTVDDDAFLAMPEQLRLGDSDERHYATHNYYGLSAVGSFVTGDVDAAVPNAAPNLPFFEASTPASSDLFRGNAPKWHPPHRTRLSNGEPDSPFRVIRSSRTWDARQPINRLGGDNPTFLNGDIRQASSFDPWSPPSAGRESSWSSWKDPGGFSSREKLIGRVGAQDEKERDWKKLETERGDAIDLLACLVDQSLNFKGFESDNSNEFLCEGCRQAIDGGKMSLNEGSTLLKCDECLEKIKLVANSMKDTNDDSHDNGKAVFSDDTRSRVIDALLHSFEFAREVRRSSLSASKWLDSIGCDEPNGSSTAMDDVALKARLNSKQQEINRLNEELASCRAEIGSLKSQSMSPVIANKSILSSSSSDDSADALVLQSSAVKPSESHDESWIKWERKIETQMNLEARKEILLLRAALEKASSKVSALEQQQQQQEPREEDPFTSEIEPIETKNADGDPEDLFLKIAQDIEAEALDTPVEDDEENIDSIPAIKLDDPALEKELADYKDAVIAALRADENGRSTRAEPSLADDSSKSHSSDVASDRKMVNVRMIDGENFSTEWGDTTLPPPPDHNLRSPIVDAILSKWSDDPNTRSALIGWIENIMSGANIDSMPSLKLSGLDHTVRDGFMMHVLPILLRRKDLHVHLSSRAHRQTTYDIAVSVSRSFHSYDGDGVLDARAEDSESQQGQPSRESQRHLMAFKATRSGAYNAPPQDRPSVPMKEDNGSQMSPTKGRFPDLFRNSSNAGSMNNVSIGRAPSNAGSIYSAVTSPISNQTPTRGPLKNRRNVYTSLSSEMKTRDNSLTHTSPSLVDDLSAGSSVEDEDDDADSKNSHGQFSIRSGLQSISGLLSRSKPSSEPHASNVLHTPTREVSQSAPKSMSEDEHPYHRIVTAPPGKIGITILEYRGHAMVSSVSPESPLAGWVFPSDVLIAIDNTPVSGLRTREIVKLLTDRAGQQRNLRMVSSRPGTA